MKKGFTIVELLGVIVIMATILLVAVPIYNSVRDNINQSLYESKIREVLSKSETYAEETGKRIFDIKKLIHEGRLTADNELEEFLDPRNGRNMACDIINVSYEESLYHASIRESEVCYTEDELESMYGLVHLKILDENKNPIESIPDTIWLKEKKVYVTYEIREENIEIDSLTWTGEEDVHCEKEELSRCKFYEITTGSVKNTTVTLNLHYDIEGISIDTRVIKEVNLDIQRPRVIDGSVNVNNELSTESNRRVDFEITDGGGSGVKEYAIVKERTCKGTEYNQKKKSASDGIQTEYLENGNYYICVEDQVGNRTSDEDLENVANQIHVSNIDKGSPVIHEFSIRSRESYKSLKTVLTINSSDDNGIENLKMCISNTGYLKDCSWERYNTTKNWDLLGTLDGIERTVYLSIQDASGNITNREAKYTPYKECSSTQKVNVGGFGACSVQCGGGVQYQNYQNKDKNTGKVCSTGKDSQVCNTQSCEPTLKRIGDYLDGIIIPLKRDRIVLVKGDGEIGQDTGAWRNSWIDVRLMDSNATTFFQKRVISGNQGMGYNPKAIRVNDNTLFITGGCIYQRRKNDSVRSYFYGGVFKISDYDISMVHQQLLMIDVDRDPVNILYQEGESDMAIYFYRPCQTSCKDYYRAYQFDEGYNSFRFKESDFAHHPRIDGDPIRLAESLLLSSYACQEDPFYPLSKNTMIGIYGNERNGMKLYETNRCYISSDLEPIYTYPIGYTLLGIARYSETKFVQLVRDENKNYHLYFFIKEGNVWNVKYIISSPSSGSLIPTTESLVLFNTKEGLYQIPYE